MMNKFTYFKCNNPIVHRLLEQLADKAITLNQLKNKLGNDYDVYSNSTGHTFIDNNRYMNNSAIFKLR